MVNERYVPWCMARYEDDIQRCIPEPEPIAFFQRFIDLGGFVAPQAVKGAARWYIVINDRFLFVEIRLHPKFALDASNPEYVVEVGMGQEQVLDGELVCIDET